ncbi:MAG: copper transporter [Actinomycetes bacterium]
MDRLGNALATLSAPAADSAGAVTRPGGPAPDLTQVAAARQLLRDLDELGLVVLEGPGASEGEQLLQVVGITYLMVVSTEVAPAADRTVVALAEDVARAAPATVTVGELAPPRDAGGVSASTSVPDAGLLGDLRTDDELVSRLSTVDDLEEAFGRLAAVLALQQEGSGAVGHYGNGPGATAPFPLTTR